MTTNSPIGATLPPPVVTATAEQLRAVLDALGAPAYRMRQVTDAVWRPQVAGFSDVIQLPADLRGALVEAFTWNTVEATAVSIADGGNTVKFLGSLADGQTIETVAMESPATARSRRRATVCVSSQVGCAVGCPFCATGQMGLTRHCSAAEIVDQVRVAASLLSERGLGPVTHVVFMGMGEPLANFDAVLQSLKLLTGAGGISARRITVSTSGVVPAIDRLTAEALPVTLAISLHAANNTLRDKLVPLNRAHRLETLIAAAERNAAATGRRISLEWCLIGGVNDSVEDGDELRELAYHLQAHVNVIPMNHVDGSPWGPPDRSTTEQFLARLHGVRYTTRDTRGAETDAACGQLRAGLARRRTVQADGTLSKPIPLTRTKA